MSDKTQEYGKEKSYSQPLMEKVLFVDLKM